MMARYVAVLVLAVLVASCGGNGDSELEVGDPSAVSQRSGPESTHTEAIAGHHAVLVVDGEARATEFVRPSDSAPLPAVEASAVLPGRGPLTNITGVQVDRDRWVVAGNDCDSMELVDPAGCSPGTLTLAMVEGETWVELDGLPEELTKAFVSVYSVSNGRVLLGRWDRGRLPLLGPRCRGSQSRAGRLGAGAPRPRGGPCPRCEHGDTGRPTRMACLVDDRLVVIESRDGAELEAQITVVDPDDPAAPVVVAGAPRTLAAATAQMPPICEDGQVPYLIATVADGAPLAYEMWLTDATFGPAIVSDLDDGLLSAISYGPGTVAVQLSDPGAIGVPGDTVPAGPDASADGDDVTSAGPANQVAVFRDGRWQRLGPQAAVTANQVVQPLGDPELPLVVTDRGRDARYRLVEVNE